MAIVTELAYFIVERHHLGLGWACLVVAFAVWILEFFVAFSCSRCFVLFLQGRAREFPDKPSLGDRDFAQVLWTTLSAWGLVLGLSGVPALCFLLCRGILVEPSVVSVLGIASVVCGLHWKATQIYSMIFRRFRRERIPARAVMFG